jgi:hypothetical protein
MYNINKKNRHSSLLQQHLQVSPILNHTFSFSHKASYIVFYFKAIMIQITISL